MSAAERMCARGLVGAAAILSLAVSASQAEAAETPTIVAGAPAMREPPFPASASGIAYIGGTNYYVVADDAKSGEVGLYRAAIALSDDGLSVLSVSSGPRVVLEGCADLEAVAYDPLTKNVWAADESRKTIAEYNPETGAKLRSLAYPEEMKNTYKNLGFESLAMSEDGLTMWTANEEALVSDGPKSSYESGTKVRLVKFERRGPADEWRHVETVPYTTEKWNQQYDCGGNGRRGVSELCVLPDGSLLVLERELSSGVKGSGMAAAMAARFMHEIFLVSGGKKTSVYRSSADDSGAVLSNCEGMCLGPRTADGARSLLVITDAGDGFTSAQIRPCRLEKAARAGAGK